MASVKIYLDPRKVRKNGESPIYLTVNLNYKKLFFNTGVGCKPDQFDQKKGFIKGAGKDIDDRNLIVARCSATINDIFVRYRLQNIELTPDLLRNEYLNPSRRIDFYAFVKEVIAERKSEMRPQTTKNHNTAVTKLKEFKPELAFSEITPDFLERYRRWLKTKRKTTSIPFIQQ